MLLWGWVSELWLKKELDVIGKNYAGSTERELYLFPHMCCKSVISLYPSELCLWLIFLTCNTVQNLRKDFGIASALTERLAEMSQFCFICLLFYKPHLLSDSITQSPVSQQDISFNLSPGLLRPSKKRHDIRIFQFFLSVSINQNQQKLFSFLFLLTKKKSQRNSWLISSFLSDNVKKHGTLSYLCLIFKHQNLASAFCLLP